jgi:hypothetical protein
LVDRSDSAAYPDMVRMAFSEPVHHALGGIAGPSLAGENCPDCGNHTMAFGLCLLALTLLVVRWLLIPPLLRHLPPSLLGKPPPVLALLGRQVPSMTLVQLSVRRT